MRLSKQVKSGLYKSLKWRVSEGSLSDRFNLKVPNLVECKDLIQYLRAHAEPATTYFNPKGGVAAWQWSLRLQDFRPLWTAPGRAI